MKLVIDIDEEDYKELKKDSEISPRLLSRFEWKVVKGTPLPKALEDIKAEERPKGKWIEGGYYMLPCVCSYCGNEGKYDMKFCPNCGAEMEE